MIDSGDCIRPVKKVRKVGKMPTLHSPLDRKDWAALLKAATGKETSGTPRFGVIQLRDNTGFACDCYGRRKFQVFGSIRRTWLRHRH